MSKAIPNIFTSATAVVTIFNVFCYEAGVMVRFEPFPNFLFINSFKFFFKFLMFQIDIRIFVLVIDQE